MEIFRKMAYLKFGLTINSPTCMAMKVLIYFKLLSEVSCRGGSSAFLLMILERGNFQITYGSNFCDEKQKVQEVSEIHKERNRATYVELVLDRPKCS